MRALLPFLRLFKYNKWQLILGLVLMIGGLVASIGLLTLSGWFLAATAIAGIGALFNYFYPSASVRGLAVGRTVIRYGEKIVTHDVTFRILAKLRVQVFEKIIPLSPAVLNRYRNSDLLNRLVSDVDTLDSLYLRLVSPFITALVVIVAMTIGFSFINPTVALSLGGCLLLAVLLIPTIFYQLGKNFGAKLVKARATYRSQFLEFIQAQAELLLFNADQQIKQKMAKTEQDWQADQQKETNIAGISTAVSLFVNGMLVVLMLWLSANADLGDDEYHRAFVALFTFAALASFEIIMPLGAAFLHIGQVISAAERVTEISNQQPLVQFNGEASLEMNSEFAIQFKNLSFAYPQRENLSLEKINLQIPQGKKVAILGKTGSGKSTLLQLLVRNYDPVQGELILNGKPINAYSETLLRQQICFLTQRVHIFSDSLRANLQLASDQPISDEKMLQLLTAVGLEKLCQTEQGLDLWLGDGGRPLSGGEQRRLGLARLLLSDAKILLLDEPTEGLDRETERQILHLILEHGKDKTLLMVTHRLTDLDQFDWLCVIDDGKLFEQGRYQDLLNQPQGLFKRLVNRV